MAENLLFELVTPSKQLVSENVKMVVVPGMEGDMGVMTGHTNILSSLRPGLVDIYGDESIVRSVFVEGGFVEINNDRCSLLAIEARDVREISIEDANNRLAIVKELIESMSADSSEGEEIELSAAEAMVFAVRSRSSTDFE